MIDDVLQLLANQRSLNRANFADSQSAHAEVAASRPRQWEHYGRDADSGTMAIAPSGGDAQLLGVSTTSGLMKRGQPVRVNASGGTVRVDQRPAARVQTKTTTTSSTPANIKILASVITANGIEIYVGGWQSDPVLVATLTGVSANQVGFDLNATLANLGGDDWQVDLCYAIAGHYYAEVISSDGSRNYKHETPVLCVSKGYGFFTATLNEQPSSTNSQSSGTTLPITITETTVVGSSQQFYLFNQVQKVMDIPGYTYTNTIHIVDYGYGGTSNNNASATIQYSYDQLLLPGDSEFSSPVTTRNYGDYIVTAIVSSDGAGLDTPSVSGTIQDQIILRINADGSGGVGQNTLYPLPGNTQYIWVDPDENNVDEDADFFVVPALIDVFNGNFTMLDPSDISTFYAAIYWTENTTLHLNTYSTLFALYDQLEIAVYPLPLPNGAQPIIYAGSYHP